MSSKIRFETNLVVSIEKRLKHFIIDTLNSNISSVLLLQTGTSYHKKLQGIL